jgi:8-oxo-dGTP pyrophosphatase MutT (NUDIX family)
MSRKPADLFSHVSALYEAGHRREVTDLHSDARFGAASRTAKAAVLIAITDRAEEDGGPGVILTQRPDTMRDHPGQVAFPGGKLEQGETAITGALREAEEELALDPSKARIIGPTDRYQTGTGFDITPVLAIIPPDLPLVAEPREVESWFEAPLALVMDERNWTHNSVFWNGADRAYLELDHKGYRIWGVTAAILANMSRRLQWMDHAHG